MGTPETRERRKAILLGFRRLIAERGYETPTLEEIARAGGIPLGAFQYHFADKHQVLLGLVEDLARESGEALDAALATAGEDPDGRLDAWITARLGPAGEAGALALAAWVAVAAEALRDVDVRRAYERALGAEAERLVPLVEAALVARGRPAEEAPAVASALLAALHGGYVLGTASIWQVPPKGLAEQVRRMARALLAGPA